MNSAIGLTGPAEDSVTPNRAVIQISRPLHARLMRLKREQQTLLQRQVTFTEVIEQLFTKAGEA